MSRRTAGRLAWGSGAVALLLSVAGSVLYLPKADFGVGEASRITQRAATGAG